MGAQVISSDGKTNKQTRSDLTTWPCKAHVVSFGMHVTWAQDELNTFIFFNNKTYKQPLEVCTLYGCFYPTEGNFPDPERYSGSLLLLSHPPYWHLLLAVQSKTELLQPKTTAVTLFRTALLITQGLVLLVSFSILLFNCFYWSCYLYYIILDDLLPSFSA